MGACIHPPGIRVYTSNYIDLNKIQFGRDHYAIRRTEQTVTPIQAAVITTQAAPTSWCNQLHFLLVPLLLLLLLLRLRLPFLPFLGFFRRSRSAKRWHDQKTLTCHQLLFSFVSFSPSSSSHTTPCSLHAERCRRVQMAAFFPVHLCLTRVQYANWLRTCHRPIFNIGHVTFHSTERSFDILRILTSIWCLFLLS